MYLIGMWFGGVPPFTKRVKFTFDEHVNVFVGPNASGKSALLMALAQHFMVLDEDTAVKRPSNDTYMGEYTEFDFDDVVEDLEHSPDDEQFNIIAADFDWVWRPKRSQSGGCTFESDKGWVARYVCAAYRGRGDIKPRPRSCPGHSAVPKR